MYANCISKGTFDFSMPLQALFRVFFPFYSDNNVFFFLVEMRLAILY